MLLSYLGGLSSQMETLDRYRALPPYPTIIVSRFDSFEWAAGEILVTTSTRISLIQR